MATDANDVLADDEVRNGLTAEGAAVSDSIRKLMGESGLGTGVKYDPNDPDLQLMGDVIDYHDNIPFSETFQVPVESVAACAGHRAQKVVDQVWDEYLEVIDLPTELQDKLRTDMKETAILMWLDAFTTGQRFMQRKAGLPEEQIYQAPPEEHAYYDGNRRQRRRARRKK